MPTSQKPGDRVRRGREAVHMTRAELAEATALPEALIAGLEDDGLRPPLGPLQKIARVLNVRLSAFIDEDPARDPVINRSGERALDLAGQRSADASAACRFHPLAKGKTDRRMEPFFVKLSPAEEPRPSSPQGEEFLLVASGEPAVRYGRETHLPSPGDTIYSNSVVPHSMRAHGGGGAAVYVVLPHHE